MRYPALAVLALLAAGPAEASSWRLRAREHFETGTLNLADGQGDLAYRGFLSAFDVFREDPFRLLYGLTVHRGTLRRVGRDEKARITAVGLELKHFPVERAPWFWRGGLLSTGVDPADSGGDFWTHGFLLGAGAELPVWRLGLAPELGGRFAWGARGKRLTDLYVALGVHFYVFKGDPSPGSAPRSAR
ncbi:MAG: hypothetical protein HY554_12740 [Elusimicrobia bacterium]|nr:hypothetical protein [Elusimicrobiota bacterium]